MKFLSRVVGALQRPGALKLTVAIAAAAWGAGTLMNYISEGTEAAEQIGTLVERKTQELQEIEAACGQADKRFSTLMDRLEKLEQAVAAHEAEQPETD